MRSLKQFRIIQLFVGILVANFLQNASAFTPGDADAIINAFNASYYNSGQYLANQTTGPADFWKWAEMTEMQEDVCERNPSPTNLALVVNLLNGFDAYQGTDWSANGFNDDICWACLAHLRGYQITGNSAYLNTAKANFDMMYARAWDTSGTTVPPVGGLFWTTSDTTKNSCVNFPGAIAAYLLYQDLGDSSYYAKATNIFYWGKTNLYNSTNGQVFDSLTNQAPTTYNQGTFIGIADYLGDTNNATRAANYLMNMGNTAPNSSGYKLLPDYDPTGDLGGFNGIGIRWIVKYMNDANLQSTYLPWLQANAQASWSVRRPADNLSWDMWHHQTTSGSNLWSFGCSPSVVAMAKVPCPTNSLLYEAENAMLSGPIAASSYSGYSGTGYADFQNASGDYVQWTFNVTSAGRYTLVFRYANGDMVNRPLALSVNGTVVNSGLSFPSTGDWNQWSTANCSVNLNAGANTVRLTAIGWNGGNIDYLQVQLPNAIGINFAGRQWSIGGNTPESLTFTDIAGVYPLQNWNNADPSGNNSGGLSQIVGPIAGAISDDSGTATGVGFFYSAQGMWAVSQTTNAGNRQLLNGYLDAESSSNGSCTISNIPYANYDVYVYVSADQNGRTAGIGINGGSQTYLLTDASGYNYSTPLIQATATSQGSATAAHYAYYHNVTGSSLQVNLYYYGANVGLAGVQIVGVSNAPPTAPTGLAASAGNSQVVLTWNASGGASGYTVKRSITSGGPYSIVAVGINATSYMDTAVTAGTTYYYAVSATSADGESSNSTEAAVTVPISGSVISINFQGADTNIMGVSETAGVIVSSNWNSAANASGFLASLKDSTGLMVAATAKWSCNNTWSTPITDAAGNNRMMKGYLDTSSSSTTTITVSNLPATYTVNGYDVYVYCDGDNGTASRTGSYAIGSTTIAATDSGGTDFSGIFTQAINSTGNYVVFAHLNATNFTLAATPTSFRAPVNGIQIVSYATPLPPTGLIATPASSSQISLNWTASPSATTYSVKRSLTNGGPYTVIATGLTTTSFADTGLTPGTTYYYVVSAINSNGSSDSSQASATLSTTGRNISSLNGNITATVDVVSNNLVYSISYLGRAVLENAPLGPLLGTTNLGSGVTIISSNAYCTNETFVSRHTIHATATNNYSGQMFTVNHVVSGISYVLDMRVWNNGVAFRYEMNGAPAQEFVTGEASGFVLPANSTVWYVTNNIFFDEWFYSSNGISAISAGTLAKSPVAIQLSGTNGYIALAQALPGIFGAPNLQKASDITGRMLQIAYPTNYDGTTGASLAWAANNPWGASASSAALNTPWNVVMIAPDLNTLLNNDIVESLALAPDPNLFPQGAATSWVTTGKSVWDYINPWPGGITMTNAMTNSSWASQLGFAYNTVDEGWANWNSGNPWPQVSQLVNYSHSLGVKVILWINSSQLQTESQRTTFYQNLVDNGVDGFKADFWNWSDLPDAADKVALQQYVIREAATNHLVVLFHGIREPMGEFRTYPNLIQWKALMARDYYPQAWQAATIPLIRWLVGPADYGPEDGAPYDYEIGSLIDMSGPAIILPQRSDGIALNAFASLIASVPNQWEQTIVLPQSELGQTVALARRKGQDWYVGIMNGNLNPPESWSIPLTFLTAGTNYQADLVYQGASKLFRTNVTSGTVLSVTDTITNGSFSGAGFAAHIYPVPATNANSSLTGVIIGTSGSWNNSGNTVTNVFDHNLNTFFDGPDASGDWAGLDFGVGVSNTIGRINYCPRSSWTSRMVGGVFQGANQPNFSDAVALATVGYAPQDGVFTTVNITNGAPFRYVRYVGPVNGYCDVAEIQFFTSAPPAINSSWNGTQLILSWPSGGMLLEATNLTGPWTTNLSATSPFSITPTRPQKFYRTQF